MPRPSNPNNYELAPLIDSSHSRRFDEASIRAEFENQIQARLNGLNATYFRELYLAVDVYKVSISEIARRTGYSRKTIYEHLSDARSQNGKAEMKVGDVVIADSVQSRSKYFTVTNGKYPIPVAQADNGVDYQNGPFIQVNFPSPHTPPGAPDNFRPLAGKALVQLYSMVNAPEKVVGNLPEEVKSRFSLRFIEGDEELGKLIAGAVNRTGTHAAEIFAWITDQG